ncbi:MAG: hypothetical protein AAF652_01575 [Cyanobacteria bacterium P01_C01_bin.72]
MNSNISDHLQTCSACGVSITEDGQVNFSNGNPGSRTRLYARVCQYTEKPGCINKESNLIGEISREDSFESGEDLLTPFSSASQVSN